MKNAQRIENNKKALKTALINNCNGDINNITVAKLCELTDISRTTFYNYYDGIHSIIEELEEEFLAPIFNPQAEHTLDFYVDIMLKNPKEYSFLLNNSRFVELSFKSALRIGKNHFNNHNDITDEAVRTISLFIIPGYINLIKNFSSPDCTITKERMGELFCIIEKHAYAMIEEYNAIE